MRWSNVKLIFRRELSDQLRDRRTVFTIAILPLLLYPLMGTCLLQVSQFMQESPTPILVVGTDNLPEHPALIENTSFAAKYCTNVNVDLLPLELQERFEEGQSIEDTRAKAEELVRRGEYGVVILFPDKFAAGLNKLQNKSADSKIELPKPIVIANSANDRSRVVFERVNLVLSNWRNSIVLNTLQSNDIPLDATKPVPLEVRDIANDTSRGAALWSKLLPFVIIIWGLTGAFYPAIDLCAGEKERGTLETLLSSPAQRVEIVWGKLLTIMSFSIATALLNLAGMYATGSFIITQMDSNPLGFGAPPLQAAGWLVLASLPISALFSALSLAIASFARSSKEGQYYLMPLMMFSLPLIILPVLPTAELSWGTSLIPITGLMLLLKHSIEGHYFAVAQFLIPVLASTALCCWLAIRWAVDQFSKEQVLFRTSEHWGVGHWVRYTFRERGETPAFGAAILCAVFLLMIRFFANFLIVPPTGWSGFASVALVTQVAMIAAPALIMAIFLTRNPIKTFSLRLPTWQAIPAAILMAICLQPAVNWLAAAINYLYPMNEESLVQLAPILQAIQNAPLGQLLLVMAVAPAICEELAFRGFILSGMRHMGHKWLAIGITAAFFGITHGIIQQSLNATVVGVLIGYLVVQSGSLLPAIAFHVTHNSLAMLRTRVDSALYDAYPALHWIIGGTGEELAFTWLFSVVATIVAGLLILWFRSLPYVRYQEEVLQEARDHQHLPSPA